MVPQILAPKSFDECGSLFSGLCIQLRVYLD